MSCDTQYIITRRRRSLAAAVLVLLLILMAPQGVMAEDGSGDWRPTYDLAMRWINFFILIFLILKYARKPLANFFREKSEDVRREIQAVEKEKEAILARVADMLEAREHSQEKLENLKARIITQGRAKKQRIIEDARKESEMMLEGARRKIESLMASAQKDIRAEMIDLAIEMALEKLPGVMAEEDNQKLYRQYLEYTESPPAR
jgi:F-type H+-transporting ATPase subunit b